MTGVGPYLIRPIAKTDLDGFYELAVLSGDGFTSLQADRAFLKRYIDKSLESFAAPKKGVAQKFLLVMEEIKTGAIVGCAAIKTNLGEPEAFLNYQMVDATGKAVADVDQANALVATAPYDGAAEVGSLFLHPDHRMGGVGRFLAKSRYLLIAAGGAIFGDRLVAELRGMQDETATPFYDAVHRSRLNVSFADNDNRVSGLDQKTLESLIADEPVLIDTLPSDARAIIGEPHETGRGAYRLLLAEGFIDGGIVDLFDAGPIVAAKVDDLVTIRASLTRHACVTDEILSPTRALLTNDALQGFKAVIAECELSGGRVRVTKDVAAALGVDNDGQQSLRICLGKETQQSVAPTEMALLDSGASDLSAAASL